ncbi:hypothetical protein M0R04_08875 [Candidatus Dojkabacteria bacterium]|jgi:hypothetical protein|nr:hypothetical protein [Candidatus Dojkabacteria bacterium]
MIKKKIKLFWKPIQKKKKLFKVSMPKFIRPKPVPKKISMFKKVSVGDGRVKTIIYPYRGGDGAMEHDWSRNMTISFRQASRNPSTIKFKGKSGEERERMMMEPSIEDSIASRKFLQFAPEDERVKKKWKDIGDGRNYKPINRCSVCGEPTQAFYSGGEWFCSTCNQGIKEERKRREKGDGKKFTAIIYKKKSPAIRVVYPKVTEETIEKYKKTQPEDEIIEIEDEEKRELAMAMKFPRGHKPKRSHYGEYHYKDTEDEKGDGKIIRFVGEEVKEREDLNRITKTKPWGKHIVIKTPSGKRYNTKNIDSIGSRHIFPISEEWDSNTFGDKNTFDIEVDEELGDGRMNPQLNMGIKAESEHRGTVHYIKNVIKTGKTIPDKVVFKKIAMDHLKEDPMYYTKLAKIEKKNVF